MVPTGKKNTEALLVASKEGGLELNAELATYRVIRKSLRDFWPLWYSSRDGHTEGEHINR
jgi:hypothetical protein